MCKILKNYIYYILIISALFIILPTYAFGAEIPSGYIESTKADSKISTDVYLTTHEKSDIEDLDKNITYTVEFYLQNIENDNYTHDINSTKELNGKENDTVTINKKNAPKFSGFILNENKGITSGQLSSKNELTIKLYYDRNLINISIDPENEAGNKDEQIIKYGSKLEKPIPEKEKDGYKFNGWVDEDGNIIDFTKPFLKDTTIKPSWLPDASSGDGGNTGTGGDKPGGDNTGDGEDDNNKQYRYIIKYWYDDELKQNDGIGKIGDKIPYELINPTKYKGLNFILESFKVTKHITNDEQKNVSEIFYTLDIKDRNGNNVPTGDGIPDKYQTPSDKYTTEDTFAYKVSYNYKEKTELIDSVTQTGQGTVGSVIPYSYVNVVDKDGQTFRLDSLVVNSNIITPNETKNTVEVNYLLTNDEQTGDIEPVQYMVSADPDNGEPIIIYYVKEGEKLPDLSNPTKDGCKFIGWVDNKGNSVDANTIVDSNMALKALWQLKDTAAEYTVSHYKPANADDSQEFQGFELVTIDKYTGEVGSTVQVKAKNWDNYKVDTTNKNSVMSGVISSDGSLVLRVFYIADNTSSDTKPGDSGNTSGGGSGSAGGSGSGGGNHSGGKPSGNNKPEKPSDSNNGSTEFNDNFEMLIGLDKTNHIAYIKGYTDGTMQPNGNITRGEVAEIVYRLMTNEYRDAHYTTENQFSDVIANIWCNASISTDSNAGILKGYKDGEFKFNNYITRAEFATIVSRFFKIDTTTQSEMTDIQGHWAEEAINKVAAVGWVQGYENNTFKPNNFITRAEVVTIFNRILERHVSKDGLIDERIEWPDVDDTSWYYLDIQEATNAHTYVRDADYSELWQSVVE